MVKTIHKGAAMAESYAAASAVSEVMVRAVMVDFDANLFIDEKRKRLIVYRQAIIKSLLDPTILWRGDRIKCMKSASTLKYTYV